MAENQTNTGVVVHGNLSAHDIKVVIASQPRDTPPKNIRFKVEKPIQTFTGREIFLQDLDNVVKKKGQNLGEGGITVLTQPPLSVVAATGGIGKTETVRMYISLHEHEYDHIVWIDAEDTSFAKTQFLQLAMELQISTDFDGKPKEFELILKQIFEKLLLNAHVVLLVFDNAAAFEGDHERNLSGIRSLLPKSLSPFFIEPSVIVTSRNQDWRLQNVIHLDLWTEAEVVLFVIRRLQIQNTSENKALAGQLGTLFGRLPIAIQSAVAVILQQTKRKKKYYGIQNLIAEYENGSRRVLGQKPYESNMRPNHMSFTMLVLWNISLEKIVKFTEGELAIKILCFMAYMSPTSIPQDFLYALFQNSYSQDSFENALEILEDYSLIASTLSSADATSHSLTIHRMIQDSTVENLRKRTNDNDSEGQTTRTSQVIFNDKTFLNETEVLRKLATESVKYINTFTMPTLPHAADEIVENLVRITNHVSDKLHYQEFKDLTEEVASVLRDTNDFTKSVQLYERALQATPSSSEVKTEILKRIVLKSKLARACKDSGIISKTIELYFQILDEYTRALGPHHEETLGTKSLIADALHRQGKYDEATAKFREVLSEYQDNNAGDDQSQSKKSFLATKNNFAVHLIDKGETEEALTLLKEVLHEKEKDPQLTFKNLIPTKSNIASVLVAQRKFVEASEIMCQNVRDATEAYGPTNLNTLICQRNYATLLLDQGKHDLAAPIFLELLQTQETKLGSHHPDTLITKGNLASLYVKTHEFDKALPLLDVEDWERVFGPEHPNTMACTSNLAEVMLKRGEFQDALASFTKVFENRTQVLGSNHPDTLRTLNSIGEVYLEMLEFDSAAKTFQDVLLRREELLGKNNPETNKTLELLTDCRKVLKERQERV